MTNETSSLIVDANGIPIPQFYDPTNGTWVAATDGPLTEEVDFSSTSLLRDANSKVIPQYWSVALRKWVPKTSEGGSSEGPPGANGKSAYEIAVSNGYTGTETQWLASLKGTDGKKTELTELTELTGLMVKVRTN